MKKIDLNCDLGEGAPDDAAVLPFITSANVACGVHAGSPTLMRQTLAAAAEAGVAVGAHPGFADRENFGRRAVDLPPEQVFDLVLYQVGALMLFAREARPAPPARQAARRSLSRRHRPPGDRRRHRPRHPRRP